MQRVTPAQPLSLAELRALVPGRFHDMVKAVVDLHREITAPMARLVQP